MTVATCKAPPQLVNVSSVPGLAEDSAFRNHIAHGTVGSNDDKKMKDTGNNGSNCEGTISMASQLQHLQLPVPTMLRGKHGANIFKSIGLKPAQTRTWSFKKKNWQTQLL